MLGDNLEGWDRGNGCEEGSRGRGYKDTYG